MNAVTPPIPLIPENAPFAPAQRAWLNSFLAGLYGGAAQPMSPAPPEVAEKVEDVPGMIRYSNCRIGSPWRKAGHSRSA